ncbi:MAG TPA: NlpC/P60 family protein [Actinomycetota bacterium]|nr:NlpC/P60 family protein [Actinomycetota bacterium]
MSSTPKRLTRLAAAIVIVVPTIVVAVGSASVAAPTKAEVEAARAKADEIGHELEVAIEQYNDARVRLQGVQDKLADALADKEASEALAAKAMGQLEERAVEAYTGAGSQMDVLLGASDISEFSDRLEFMGALAQNDADLATEALTAQQQAEWAAERYGQAIEEKQAELDQMAARRGDIERMLAEQEALADKLGREYQDYLDAQAAQAAAAAAAESAAASDTGSGGGGSVDTGGGGGTFVPPPNSSAAQIAIAAAKTRIGATYVWGTAGPDTFDCSGLTSWAYAQAGVYLPHSSAAQASAFPTVPYSAAQPGDLLFFYSPVSHVALYMGGGMMIHARHPGPGGQVQIGSVGGYGTPVVKVTRPT